MSGPLAIIEARARLYARAGLPPGSLPYLRESGLALARLGDPDPIAAGCGCLVVTGVKRVGKDRFDFVQRGERGVRAAVVEVFGHDGASTIDLCAWPVGRPAELRTMFGSALLGLVNVHNAWTYAMGSPLRVHRTAVGWLRDGARGAVVLNPAEAARKLLDAPGPIAGEDHRHAAALAGLVASLVDQRKFVAPRDTRRAA